MAYTTIDKSTDYYSTKKYSGTGSAQSITGVGFQPDWCWIKNASSGSNYSHQLYDTTRGVTKYLQSNSSASETTQAEGLTAFGTDGFSVGTNAGVNSNGSTLISWNWKANGAGSANTNGSINSTVSANTTSGFSIVTYTGTGANATVGHGLGSAPRLILFKQTNATQKWIVHHQSIGATKSLHLDTTEAEQSNAFMNNTSPTSSVFSLGTIVNNNTSGATYVAYCFAEKKGFSKFGQYTGNGSTDGAFIFCGFKPALVIFKKTNDVGDWQMVDDKREGYNPDNDYLQANASLAEQTTDIIDLVSNGFKIRGDDSNGWNKNGSTYLWIAFAKAPLVGSNNVPATAR